VHNGNGHGKKWVLIGLLVLGGFWLVNDAYDDGYRDALVQSGQEQTVRHYRGGPHFPWGLVILGGIGYVAWRKGAFDRFGGPGGPFNGGYGNGQQGVQRYGPGNAPAQMPGSPLSGPGFGPGFREPRAFFDDWHRQAHEEASRAQYPAPPVPPAPAAPPAGSPAATPGAGTPEGGFAPTPPPTPPAPEYWASMAGAAGSGGTPGAPGTPNAGQDGSADGPRGTAGTQL
jgi:hypothetical protein